MVEQLFSLLSRLWDRECINLLHKFSPYLVLTFANKLSMSIRFESQVIGLWMFILSWWFEMCFNELFNVGGVGLVFGWRVRIDGRDDFGIQAPAEMAQRWLAIQALFVLHIFECFKMLVLFNRSACGDIPRWAHSWLTNISVPKGEEYCSSILSGRNRLTWPQMVWRLW